MTRNVLFAVVLLILGGSTVVFPAMIGYCAFGAIAATVVWIYFSLRDADLERGFGSVDLNDGANVDGGLNVPRHMGPANSCSDLAAGGVSCDGDGSGGDHA